MRFFGFWMIAISRNFVFALLNSEAAAAAAAAVDKDNEKDVLKYYLLPTRRSM